MWCWKRMRYKVCLDICALFVCVGIFFSFFCFECKVFAQPQLERLSGTKLCVWYALRWDVFYAKCELCRNDATLKNQQKISPDTMRLGRKQPTRNNTDTDAAKKGNKKTTLPKIFVMPLFCCSLGSTQVSSKYKSVFSWKLYFVVAFFSTVAQHIFNNIYMAYSVRVNGHV